MSELNLIDSVTKPEDCEKRSALTGLDWPAIRFVPEKDKGPHKTLEVVLRLNPDSKSLDNTVKRKIIIFSQGSIEALLRWKQDVDEVVERKPCSKAQSMFDMTELLLGGDPQATWRSISRDKCLEIKEDGTLKGKTIETYKAAMDSFLSHYFPKTGNPARKQKRYLQQCLYKPKSVKVVQVITRLKTINRLLTLFPKPENTELSEGAQIDILVNMCPSAWIFEMAKHKFDPAEHSLDEVKFELERHEIMGEIESANKRVFDKKNKRKSSDDSDDEKPNKSSKKKRKLEKYKGKNKKEHGGDSKPPCQYCKFFGGNAESHSSVNCFRKAEIDKIWKKNLDRKKNKKHSHELNKLIAKKVKATIKKSLKKNELSYASSDSAESETSL